MSAPTSTQDRAERSSFDPVVGGTSGRAPTPSMATACWPAISTLRAVEIQGGEQSPARGLPRTIRTRAEHSGSICRTEGCCCPEASFPACAPCRSQPAPDAARGMSRQTSRCFCAGIQASTATYWPDLDRSERWSRRFGSDARERDLAARAFCETCPCIEENRTFCGYANRAGSSNTPHKTAAYLKYSTGVVQ